MEVDWQEEGNGYCCSGHEEGQNATGRVSDVSVDGEVYERCSRSSFDQDKNDDCNDTDGEKRDVLCSNQEIVVTTSDKENEGDVRLKLKEIGVNPYEI